MREERGDREVDVREARIRRQGSACDEGGGKAAHRLGRRLVGLERLLERHLGGGGDGGTLAQDTAACMRCMQCMLGTLAQEKEGGVHAVHAVHAETWIAL